MLRADFRCIQKRLTTSKNRLSPPPDFITKIRRNINTHNTLQTEAGEGNRTPV